MWGLSVVTITRLRSCRFYWKKCITFTSMRYAGAFELLALAECRKATAPRRACRALRALPGRRARLWKQRRARGADKCRLVRRRSKNTLIQNFLLCDGWNLEGKNTRVCPHKCFWTWYWSSLKVLRPWKHPQAWSFLQCHWHSLILLSGNNTPHGWPFYSTSCSPSATAARQSEPSC